MSTIVTYQSIHNWGEDIQRTSILARLGAFFTFNWLSTWFAGIAIKRVQEVHMTLHEAYSEILITRLSFAIIRDRSILEGM
jgi:hypothetical protein